LYFSLNVIWVIKSMWWAERVARMVARRGGCWVLMGKPEVKRPLERPRLR